MPHLDFFVVGEGPVVLFLHGWGQNKEMMFPLVELLKGRYKCVVVDMPGFGGSEYNNEKDLNEYCKSIHDFLLMELKLNPKYIVGHSFGGKVALAYYLKYKGIKGITFISSPLLKPKRGILYYFKVLAFKMKKKLGIMSNMGSVDYRNCLDSMKGFFVSVVNTHFNKSIKEVKIPVLLFYSKGDNKVEFKRGKKLEKLFISMMVV